MAATSVEEDLGQSNQVWIIITEFQKTNNIQGNRPRSLKLHIY